MHHHPAETISCPGATPMKYRYRLVLALALVGLWAAPVAAKPALWMIRQAHSTVYLFGTVHLLPNDTDWRYPALDRALAASDSLVIELTDDNPAHMQALVLQYGLDPAHPLSDQLTRDEQASLERAAKIAGIPGGAATLQVMRPWLAALTLAVTPLLKAGLDPAHGVDKQLKKQMTADGKPVLGLETARQQIRLLAGMPPAMQLRFLRSTLHDIGKDGSQLKILIHAWKAGDTATIARLDDEQLRQRSPKLYQRLLVERNRAWAAKIAAMLKKPGTVFIAVGAAHLAGPDSVQVQLQKLGVMTVRD